MDGQVSDVQCEEDKALQLWQVVVAQFQVEDDGALGLERGHGAVDVEHISGLAQNV